MTICIEERLALLGKVDKGEVMLSELGEIAHQHWSSLGEHYPNLVVETFVIMPNHLHGILTLKPTSDEKRVSLAKIIQGFKTFSTREINHIRQQAGAIWQRNYYEHIVRDEADRVRIQDYILNNPAQWSEDDYYTEK